MQPMRAVVADWIQIISAPVTILSIYWAWTDRLKAAATATTSSPALSLAPYAIAVALVTVAWLFFYTSLFRLMNRWATGDGGKYFLFAAIAVVAGLALFVPLELLLLEASLPQPPSAIALTFWLCVPAALWLLAALLTYLVVQ